MATTFTRRVSVTPKIGIDPRYNRPTGSFWSVKYIDASGEICGFDHFGPESVKQRLENMGVAFDFGVEVEYHVH